jgi:Calcium-dependent channel, 7TM region, putative phosphate
VEIAKTKLLPTFRNFLSTVPIVPIISIFGFVYFFGSYVVMKHQCLHVYAQEFEGGGSATWQQLFGFLMASLYMGEVVFIAYMGLKKAPIQSGLSFVPLIVTCLVHRILYRKLIAPLKNLSLEVAADVDIQHGELPNDNVRSIQLYRQPALDGEQDERGPMPYRRKPIAHSSSTMDEPA